MTDQDLLSAVEPYVSEATLTRHDLHRHPELGFEEARTSSIVAEKLRSWGIETHTGLGGTGVVGVLRGCRPGQHAIGLRADMDALPITEETGLPYASTNSGAMHACGHDGHTAMLLGAAHFLSDHPDFGGTVYFIFQPAEEKLQGGRRMIEDGLFERFPCDAVYGLHNKPGIETGVFSIRRGAMLSAADTWTVTFSGTGGHGGSGVHMSIDPTVPAAGFILALQSIVSRSVPAIEPAVVSVGHIAAGRYDGPNVLPRQILIRGTARSYAPAIRDLIERRMREIAAAHAATNGSRVEVVYDRLCPPTMNHEDQAQVALDVAASLVGQDRVIDGMPPIMGAEDFSFMLERKPGAFMMLGNGGTPGPELANLHTPRYDFNDALLPLGIAYWAGLVKHELGQAG